MFTLCPTFPIMLCILWPQIQFFNKSTATSNDLSFPVTSVHKSDNFIPPTTAVPSSDCVCNSYNFINLRTFPSEDQIITPMDASLPQSLYPRLSTFRPSLGRELMGITGLTMRSYITKVHSKDLQPSLSRPWIKKLHFYWVTYKITVNRSLALLDKIGY